jgi:hypothetical protein
MSKHLLRGYPPSYTLKPNPSLEPSPHCASTPTRGTRDSPNHSQIVEGHLGPEMLKFGGLYVPSPNREGLDDGPGSRIAAEPCWSHQVDVEVPVSGVGLRLLLDPTMTR